MVNRRGLLLGGSAKVCDLVYGLERGKDVWTRLAGASRVAAPMTIPSCSRAASPGGVLLAALILSLLSGCQTRDMSDRSGLVTDYRVGHVYQLKVHTFILARTGVLMTVDEARQQPPAQVEALLEPGTYFKVRQVVAVKDGTGGPRTEIYAEIISGPKNGRVVNLRTISVIDAAGITRRHPGVLEPFLTGY